MGEVVRLRPHKSSRRRFISRVRQASEVIRGNSAIGGLSDPFCDFARRPSDAVAQLGNPPRRDVDPPREILPADSVEFEIVSKLHASTFSPTETLAQAKSLASLCGQDGLMHEHFSMSKPREKPPVRLADGRELPAQYIREWRKYRKLTLEELAEQIGMSPGNLSNIERGVTPYNRDHLQALADTLDCTIVDLLSRDPDETDPFGSLWKSWTPQQRAGMLELMRLLFPKSKK